jgi:hypothetical protein
VSQCGRDRLDLLLSMRIDIDGPCSFSLVDRPMQMFFSKGGKHREGNGDVSNILEAGGVSWGDNNKRIESEECDNVDGEFCRTRRGLFK